MKKEEILSALQVAQLYGIRPVTLIKRVKEGKLVPQPLKRSENEQYFRSRKIKYLWKKKEVMEDLKSSQGILNKKSPPNPLVCTIHDLAYLYGISIPTIHEIMKDDPAFPVPINLDDPAKRELFKIPPSKKVKWLWSKKEIMAHLNSLT